MDNFRTGYVSIVGRPNVGKSTLLNRLFETKLSIVSRKPQTTRWNIQGIETIDRAQIIFIDTPGLQQRPGVALNRYMNREVMNALHHIDVVLFMVECMKWNLLDQNVLTALKHVPRDNIIILLNKLDKLKEKNKLLSFIGSIAKETGLTEILPVSASRGDGLDKLRPMLINRLPIAPPLYPADRITNKDPRFLVAEFIREKLFFRLGDELPYRLSTTIELFRENKNVIHIHAVIWVEKKGQKNIVIGKGGTLLKAVGIAARKDMEKLLEKKVNLKTWVRVKANWADSEQALRQLGYIQA